MKQCVVCSGGVGPRHHAVECDQCHEWTHRRCNTGISLEAYRAAVSVDADISYICSVCEHLVPDREVEYEEHEHEDLQTTVMEVGEGDRTFDSIISGNMSDGDDHEKTKTDMDESTQEDGNDAGPLLQSTMLERTVRHVSFLLEDSIIAPDTTSADVSVPDMEVDQSVVVDGPFTEPVVVTERSLIDPTPPLTPVDDQPLRFEMIPGGSHKGKDLLVDTHGYAYVVKERRYNIRRWRCSVRNKTLICPAGVAEKNGSFEASTKQHTHQPDPDRGITAKVTKKAKSASTNDVFKSARALVSESREGVEGIIGVGIVRENLVARAVNRHRITNRPKDPTDMDFELDHDAMPASFYRREVNVNGRRHVIFATDDQLEMLKCARRWYIDGTFKVMRKPFGMLLSIHAFVRRGDCSKQVPLIYVAMSGRKTTDYIRVFKAIRRGLSNEESVEEILCDFEVALWKSVRDVFDGVSVRGCVFHWGQAVWRHVQSLGLATEYMNDAGTYSFVRQLLCLPFLPAEHIQPTFDAMRDFNTAVQLEPLLTYVETTWFKSSTWAIADWCVFGQSVRTNNDCEGWHHRLNVRAGVAPPFYRLLDLLYEEATEASRNAQLVSEMALRRLQRRSYRTMQAKIFETWDSYRDGSISASGLLKKISTFYKPRVTRQDS